MKPYPMTNHIIVTAMLPQANAAAVTDMLEMDWAALTAPSSGLSSSVGVVIVVFTSSSPSVPAVVEDSLLFSDSSPASENKDWGFSSA